MSKPETEMAMIDFPPELLKFYKQLMDKSFMDGNGVGFNEIVVGVLEHYARKHGYEPSAYKRESKIYERYAAMRRATNERLKAKRKDPFLNNPDFGAYASSENDIPNTYD